MTTSESRVGAGTDAGRGDSPALSVVGLLGPNGAGKTTTLEGVYLDSVWGRHDRLLEPLGLAEAADTAVPV